MCLLSLQLLGVPMQLNAYSLTMSLAFSPTMTQWQDSRPQRTAPHLVRCLVNDFIPVSSVPRAQVVQRCCSVPTERTSCETLLTSCMRLHNYDTSIMM